MGIISYWIALTNYLENNQSLIIFFELLITIITAFIFLGILILTKNYAKSTKEIAEKTEESLQLSQNLRKDELTISLIKDWYNLTRKTADVIEELSREYSNLDKGMCVKILNYCTMPLEYFNLVNNLLNSKSINEDLFFKNLKSVIDEFEKQISTNRVIYCRTNTTLQDMLRGDKILSEINIIFDPTGFNEILEKSKKYQNPK